LTSRPLGDHCVGDWQHKRISNVQKYKPQPHNRTNFIHYIHTCTNKDFYHNVVFKNVFVRNSKQNKNVNKKMKYTIKKFKKNMPVRSELME
jgi:hypothetical protein